MGPLEVLNHRVDIPQGISNKYLSLPRRIETYCNLVFKDQQLTLIENPSEHFIFSNAKFLEDIAKTCKALVSTIDNLLIDVAW